MSDGIGLAEALLGLDGFRVLEVHETTDELVITIETVATVALCMRCGARAEAHDRTPIEIRDLACFGRPARLVWRKRRWRCREQVCDAKTWTERSEHFDTQRVITRRAGMEACRQVGELARPVSKVAEEFGVCWWTVMNAVVEHGTPLVDDPQRVGVVRQLGIDETSFLAANRHHATIYATGLVNLKRRIVIDMVPGNSASDLRRWTANADPRWLAHVKVVATDLAESFRAGLSPHLAHARRVADPFHVVRVANRCMDNVRRRVQNETLAHRGRKHDPALSHPQTVTDRQLSYTVDLTLPEMTASLREEPGVRWPGRRALRPSIFADRRAFDEAHSRVSLNERAFRVGSERSNGYSTKR